MNTQINKTVLLIILMICLATAVYSAVGTFTFRTSGASDTTEVVDLRYPQKVPEDASVTTDSIEDGSITNDKLAEPISVANGGTGATTAAAGLAALGGASLNGSSTVDFAAREITVSQINEGSNTFSKSVSFIIATSSLSINANIFDITTTNEAGDNDAGVYTVRLTGFVGSNAGSDTGGQAIRAFDAEFSHSSFVNDSFSMNSTPTITMFNPASINIGAYTIGDIVLSVVQTTAYQNDVYLSWEVTGAGPVVSSLYFVGVVTISYSGYIHAPEVTP